MTSKNDFTKTDTRLNSMMTRRNLGTSSIDNYRITFNQIYDLFGVTPSDIVREAKQEQKPFLNKETGTYEIIELEDRKITQYQIQYYQYLKDKNSTPRTIDLKLKCYRALLTEYNIDKPKNMVVHIPNDRIRDEDLVTWKEVKNALSYCKGIRDKALISFIATTGLRVSDVITLKIADLVRSCEIFFNEKEEHNIENLLSKDPEEIMPCWEIMPSKTSNRSQLCVTFNTFECSGYLWQYLHDRIDNNISKGRSGVLNPDEALFATSTGKHLTTSGVEQVFQRLNKQLGAKKDKNKLYRRFRPHALRKLFTTTCRRNITRVMVNTDKTSEVDIISIFTGHVPPNETISKVYEAIESDSHDSYLRKTYLALLPSLSIQKTIVKDVKTQQYKDLEKQNKVLQKQLEAQHVSMQREMDEQKQKYEKKIRQVESVNSALSSKVDDIQGQMNNIVGKNNIERIMEYIQDNDIVNDNNIAKEVVELFRKDFEEDNLLIVNEMYMEELIQRTYNLNCKRTPNPIYMNRPKEENDDNYQKIYRRVHLLKKKYTQSYEFTESQMERLEKDIDKYIVHTWYQIPKKGIDINEGIIQDMVYNIATKRNK